MNRQSIGGNRRTIRWSSLNKTETRQDEVLSTGWTDGSAAVHPTVAWKLIETVWSRGLQHRTNRRCVGSSEQLCQRIFNGYVTWRAPDEPTPRKSIASVHPTLPFSVTVSQRVFECLGLFIPPPLTHLRLLDCVEVQKSSRHLEDHIQSIQVLNCSFLDLHMPSVCA
jgi:hypothetical protein